MEPPGPTRREEQTLKADPFVQLRLLDLQEVDATLDQLAHKLATLPESRALTALTDLYDDLAARQGRLQTEIADLGREQRKAEADVEQVRSRRTRNQERIDAGQVGDPRQLQAMQHEIETLDRRVSDLEDVELDVMERLENAQAEFLEQAHELDRLAAEITETTAARDAVAADIATRRSAAEAARESLAAEVPDPLRSLYEKLRAQLGGIGVGMIKHKRCTGCQLNIGAADLARMAAAPSDEILRCEECNRILVRTDRSGL